MWLPDKVPPSCLFLPGSADIRSDESSAPPADLAVVLDTPRLERLGRLADYARSLPVAVNIDHHGSNVSWGAHNWVETGASATAELIYLLLRELGVAVDLDIATCLYAGIITDTGRFCYSNTTPFTHRIAGELLRCGVSPHSTAEKLYAQNRPEKMKLLGEALSGLSVDESGGIAWLRITAEMYEKSGANSEDADGFINYARDLVGVKVAVLFEESPDRAGVRISLRSRDGRIDVDKIARKYGGGGHPAAAGAMIQGQPQVIEGRLLDDVRGAIRSLSE
jgi:phosphoesterase RecJ-like protein